MSTEEEKNQTEKDIPPTGFIAPTTAYDEQVWVAQQEKEWSKTLHVFGERQNQINRGTAARMRSLEVENRTLKLQIEQLESKIAATEAREKKSLGRVAAQLDKLERDLNRVRLTGQLNSNAIDRLVKGPETETPPDDEETPTQS